MLLSIVVLSYNRPLQVKRILDNLLGVFSSDFNLIIKDDCSPLQSEIAEVVSSYKSRLGFEVIFHANKSNLGYDRNLLDAFNITGAEYVFLLSDDDFLVGNKILELIDSLRDKDKKVYFTPYSESHIIRRMPIHKSFDLKEIAHIIYNSILFSGLVFHRETVVSLPKDVGFLSNCIYTQVYLFTVIAYNESDIGFLPPKVLCLGGDGENYFGKNDSAINSNLLADRASVNSDLNYQKFLLEVVLKVATDTNPIVYKYFFREYSKRLIAYALRARSAGFCSYLDYMKSYYFFRESRSFFVSLCVLSLVFFPSSLCFKIYSLLKHRFKRSG